MGQSEETNGLLGRKEMQAIGSTQIIGSGKGNNQERNNKEGQKGAGGEEKL